MLFVRFWTVLGCPLGVILGGLFGPLGWARGAPAGVHVLPSTPVPEGPMAPTRVLGRGGLAPTDGGISNPPLSDRSTGTSFGVDWFRSVPDLAL